jgi:hypothetical protein
MKEHTILKITLDILKLLSKPRPEFSVYKKTESMEVSYVSQMYGDIQGVMKKNQQMILMPAWKLHCPSRR